MKILHIGNFGPDATVGLRCGISNFSVQTSYALRRAGCDVTDWDGHYPTIYAKVQRGEPAYLPDGEWTYDVIHFTWHPLAINHYGSGHFLHQHPTGPLLSLYLTDLPPWSGCPCLDRFQVRMSAEPHEILATPWHPGLIVAYPIIDWVPPGDRSDDEFVVGWTGIRGDGLHLLEEICARRGWRLNKSDPDRWLSITAEIHRLQQSTVNVCWYWDQRNIAGAPSTCLGSRRPLLINRSNMFTHLRPYDDEIYIGQQPGQDAVELEALLDRIHSDWQHGTVKQPQRVIDDLGWQRAAPQMIAAWTEARSR